LEIKVPLPPLDEQRRIVARIEQLAAKIQEAHKLRLDSLIEADALFANQSALVLEGVGCNWPVKRLDSVATKITDGGHATPRRGEAGHYLLSARNIQNEKVDLSVVDYVDETEFSRVRKRCDPSPGDVLISCSGSIGKVAVVEEADAYVMVRSVAMVRPDPAIIESQYLAHALRARVLQGQMANQSRSTAQANLFLGKIKPLQILVPPLAEQRRIVAHLDGLQAKVDALKKLQTETAAELDALMPSILDRAFRGELRGAVREPPIQSTLGDALKQREAGSMA